MTILYVATDERRVSVCIRCKGPLVMVKMLARGCYGADGRPRLTGHYWKLEGHACEPVVAGLEAGIGSPAGEQLE